MKKAASIFFLSIVFSMLVLAPNQWKARSEKKVVRLHKDTQTVERPVI